MGCKRFLCDVCKKLQRICLTRGERCVIIWAEVVKRGEKWRRVQGRNTGRR